MNTPISLRILGALLVAASVVAGALAFFLVTTPTTSAQMAADDCSLLGNAPAGYASPRNLFSSGRELLVRTACRDNNFDVLIGSNNTN